MNKETIEDVMEICGYHDKESNDLWREGFLLGAKWQAKRHQVLLDYVESDLIDQVYEANCPTRIEALKKIKAVVIYPELADKIDEAWAIRQNEINHLNYLDKLGSTYF